jgi:WD repeat-containing protein 55
LIKKFDTESGKVVSKFVIAGDEGKPVGAEEGPTALESVGEEGLLVAGDDGRLELRDLRVDSAASAGGKGKGLSGMWRPHGKEHVNAILPLPAGEMSTSGLPKSCVTVGGTTLSVTDFRKGVVKTSEDMDDELTSVVLVEGLSRSGTSVGAKVLVGQADGAVGLWEKGVWGDIDERIIVDKFAGVESLCEVPVGVLGNAKRKVKHMEKVVAAGLEDGRVRFLRIGRNGVLGEWDCQHDEGEGVVGVGFDAEGRMVSVGGEVVKVWTEAEESTESKKRKAGLINGVGGEEEDDDEDEDDEEDDSEAEEEIDSSDGEPELKQGKRKKRKRNKGKDKSGGQVMNFRF